MSEQTQNKSARTLRGVVTSNKMKDTIVVAVERFVKHPKYQKFIKRTNKFMAHDEGNTASIGDTVSIVESKPRSKNKRFDIVSDND